MERHLQADARAFKTGERTRKERTILSWTRAHSLRNAASASPVRCILHQAMRFLVLARIVHMSSGLNPIAGATCLKYAGLSTMSAASGWSVLLSTCSGALWMRWQHRSMVMPTVFLMCGWRGATWRLAVRRWGLVFVGL